jgi:hypothetical protein
LKRILPFLLPLLLACPVMGADPAPSPAPVVVFPPQAAPTPTPSPTTPQALPANQVFVFQSAVECTVLISPDSGIVKVTTDTGPITIRDVFVGGSGKREKQVFAGPFVYTLEAAGVGMVEVIAIPKGGTPVRRTLAVDNGTVPVVPPTPPTPPAPVDPLTASLQTAYNADTDAAKATNIKTLATLCRATANLNDATVTNYGQMLTKFHNARASLMPAGSLPSVVKSAGAWLNTQLPTDATAPIDKAKLATVFNQLGAALEGVK